MAAESSRRAGVVVAAAAALRCRAEPELLPLLLLPLRRHLDAAVAQEEPEALRALLGVTLAVGAWKETTVATKVANAQQSSALQQKLVDMTKAYRLCCAACVCSCSWTPALARSRLGPSGVSYMLHVPPRTTAVRHNMYTTRPAARVHRPAVSTPARPGRRDRCLT